MHMGKHKCVETASCMMVARKKTGQGACNELPVSVVHIQRSSPRLGALQPLLLLHLPEPWKSPGLSWKQDKCKLFLTYVSCHNSNGSNIFTASGASYELNMPARSIKAATKSADWTSSVMLILTFLKWNRSRRQTSYSCLLPCHRPDYLRSDPDRPAHPRHRCQLRCQEVSDSPKGLFIQRSCSSILFILLHLFINSYHGFWLVQTQLLSGWPRIHHQHLHATWAQSGSKCSCCLESTTRAVRSAAQNPRTSWTNDLLEILLEDERSGDLMRREKAANPSTLGLLGVRDYLLVCWRYWWN